MFVKIFILIMNISISTAHHVDIDYTPAGIFDRILATLIDGAFQFGLLLLGFMFIDLLTPVDSPTWFFVILAVIIASYHLFCEAVFNGNDTAIPDPQPLWGADFMFSVAHLPSILRDRI